MILPHPDPALPQPQPACLYSVLRSDFLALASDALCSGVFGEIPADCEERGEVDAPANALSLSPSPRKTHLVIV